MTKNASMVAITVLAALLGGCDQKTAESATSMPTAVENQITQTEPPTTITVTHAQGTAEIKINPANAVIFDFGTLDTLKALGVTGTVGLPKGNIPAYLAHFRGEIAVNAGNMKQPDITAITELKPDVIVITGRQTKSFDELNAIAPTLNLSMDNQRYLDSFKKNVLTLGQIFDKTAQAENGLAVLDEKISATREKAEQSGQTALVLLHFNGKFSASTSNNYAAIIHQVLGVKMADEQLQAPRQAATPEYIAQKNPDIIFIVDRNEAIGNEKIDRSLMDNDVIKQTNAFRKGKIIYLTPDLWYLSGGGLESLSLQIDEVASAL